MKYLVMKCLEDNIQKARTLNTQHFKKVNVKYSDFAEKNSRYGGSDAGDESHRSSDVSICHDGELREGHFGVYHGDHMNGKRNGHGIFVQCDNKIIIGQWANGQLTSTRFRLE